MSDLNFWTNLHRYVAARKETLQRMVRNEHWLSKIEQLRPGDACEFHYPARKEWCTGTVKVNGGAGYWTIFDEVAQKLVSCIYIEQVRLPGQTEAWAR